MAAILALAAMHQNPGMAASISWNKIRESMKEVVPRSAFAHARVHTLRFFSAALHLCVNAAARTAYLNQRREGAKAGKGQIKGLRSGF